MRIKYLVCLMLVTAACNSPSEVTNPNNSSAAIDLPDSHGITTVVSATPTPAASSVSSGGVALVWNGAGACDEDCALAGVTAANAAGLTTRYVDGTTLQKSSTAAEIAAVFQDVKVWVMPGGVSNQEYNAMSSTLINALKTFIENGGGYVGWCAGAFAATAQIGTTGATGLGIFPGSTELYYTSSKQNSYSGSIEKLTWFNDTHYFYLEGGPRITNLPSSVEVVARYDDQVSVASARTTYGNGRVWVSGVHPEAPSWWWLNTGISDPDGADTAYAADMIKWAAHQE